jgi:hypothetical protein
LLGHNSGTVANRSGGSIAGSPMTLFRVLLDSPCAGLSMSRVTFSSTYDHRALKTRLPVRSALFKQRTGGLVVKWVTISESPLLYVFAISFCSEKDVYRQRWGDIVGLSWSGAGAFFGRGGCEGVRRLRSVAQMLHHFALWFWWLFTVAMTSSTRRQPLQCCILRVAHPLKGRVTGEL